MVDGSRLVVDHLPIVPQASQAKVTVRAWSVRLLLAPLIRVEINQPRCDDALLRLLWRIIDCSWFCSQVLRSDTQDFDTLIAKMGELVDPCRA